MTLNDWRRILWFLSMSGTMALFCFDGARAQSQNIALAAPPPPAVTSVSAQPSASGLGTYCEWVIAIYPIGKSAASSPSCVSNASGSVTVNWSPGGVGVTGYDLLRTTSPSIPSGAWNGAVATNVACCSQTDNLGDLSSYTLTSAPPAQATIRLDNQVNVQPTVYLDAPFNSLKVGTTTISAVTGITDPVPLLLPKFRLALAKTLDGVSDTRVLCGPGDSTTFGQGGSTMATVTPLASWCARLVTLLNTRGIPAAPGMVKVPSANDGIAHDTRWTLGAGWSVLNLFLGLGSSGLVTGTAPAGAVVFTPGPGFSYDTFALHYTKGVGNGTLHITATGGTTTDIPTVNASQYNATVIVSAAVAATTNTVTITATGGPVYITAIEPYLSGTTKVRVGNIGVPGSTSANWIDPVMLHGLSTYRELAPDLSIIPLSINDARDSVSPATLQANLAALIVAGQATGDVVLMPPPPSSGSPYTTFEPQYQAVYRALSALYNVPIVDVYGRFGGTWNAAFMSDALHPNNAGYWDIASAVNVLLNR